MGLLDGFKSLSQNVNKVGYSDDQSETVSTFLPELTLDMKDEDLIQLARDWTKAWGEYEPLILQKQKDNEDYWLGNQFTTSAEKRPLVDNLIFESLETFLPIATRPKADPLVESDNTEEGNRVSDIVRKMLVSLADKLSYNLKMKQVTRFWALYMLGVIKVGWSMKNNDITCVAVRPQKLILDPKATIEEGRYTGYYIGERMNDEMASDLVARFPNKKQYIEDKVNKKMGTKVPYIMWTTDDYVFWTLDDEVLAKNKNPHWNYEQEVPEQQSNDEFGQPTIVPASTKPGNNHFTSPEKPYIFLSVFNLGKRPHDDTNLIQQNLPLQDLINKRLYQIDVNADNTNGGIAVSGDAFTEEQASKIAKARRKGGTLWVPTGDVNAAIKDMPGEPLPNFVYESLQDYRNELRNIFGTRGSTPQGTIKEQTLGGKELIKGQDSDRIGGGVSTYLEQFSDRVFNWFVQLMYVYYDEPHMASVVGNERAQEYISLSNADLNRKLTVGVKEGSMIPHDPVNQRNEAVTLWGEKGIDPITFFDRLEFPNPRESAKNLYLWLSDPVQLFPDLVAQQQAQQQQLAQAEQKGPSESISYKDLPTPSGKSQMLAQAGIQVAPEEIAIADEAQAAKEQAQKEQDMAQKQAGLHDLAAKQ